jgi:hypothetical protein
LWYILVNILELQMQTSMYSVGTVLHTYVLFYSTVPPCTAIYQYLPPCNAVHYLVDLGSQLGTRYTQRLMLTSER